jgi:hypothetical protein
VWRTYLLLVVDDAHRVARSLLLRRLLLLALLVLLLLRRLLLSLLLLLLLLRWLRGRHLLRADDSRIWRQRRMHRRRLLLKHAQILDVLATEDDEFCATDKSTHTKCA